MSKNKDLFQDHAPEERLAILQARASKISRETYRRNFTDEEIVEMKDDFARLSIEFANEERIVPTRIQAIKDDLKKKKDRLEKLLERLECQYELITDDCYLIDDQEDVKMRMYTKEGVFVKERPLTAEERQLHISVNNPDSEKTA